MPRTTHASGLRHGSRKKRQFKTPSDTIAAAVSMPEQLYMQAVAVAESSEEGNFSRYVRKLIRRDLGR